MGDNLSFLLFYYFTIGDNLLFTISQWEIIFLFTMGDNLQGGWVFGFFGKGCKGMCNRLYANKNFISCSNQLRMK